MPMNPRLLRPLARFQSPPSDPDFSSVTLLLHFDSDFSDSSENAVAVIANGNAAISSSIKKIGDGAGYFDGNGDYLVVAEDNVAQLGNANFTVEFWAYPLTLEDYTVVLGNFQDGFSNDWQLLMNGSGGLSLYDQGFASFSAPISTGQWQHIAMVRDSGNITLYLDGEPQGTQANARNFNSTNDLWIGHSPENLDRWFDGYIDELRITKGVARYTAAFTPPTEAFPDQ